MPSCTDSRRTSTTTDSPAVDGDETLAPLLGRGHIERDLAHLAGVVHDVAHVDAEGAWPAGSHEDPCYRRAAGRRLDGRQTSRAPVSRKRATAGGTNGDTSPPSPATWRTSELDTSACAGSGSRKTVSTWAR